MTKTNVQPIPSNFQHHDTPNNKTHVIKFRVTAEEKASLELTCKLLNLSLSAFIRRAMAIKSASAVFVPEKYLVQNWPVLAGRQVRSVCVPVRTVP